MIVHLQIVLNDETAVSEIQENALTVVPQVVEDDQHLIIMRILSLFSPE